MAETKQTLIIEGMHCDACKMLIQMALEENGLGQYIDQININNDNTGELVLKTDSQELQTKIVQTIKAMKTYKVQSPNG